MQGKVVSLGRTWAVKLLMVLVGRLFNLSTKEEMMLRTSWMAETMIGANDGSRLDPASFCRESIKRQPYYHKLKI